MEVLTLDIGASIEARRESVSRDMGRERDALLKDHSRKWSRVLESLKAECEAAGTHSWRCDPQDFPLHYCRHCHAQKTARHWDAEQAILDASRDSGCVS